MMPFPVLESPGTLCQVTSQRLFQNRIQTQLQKLEEPPQNISCGDLPGEPFAGRRQVEFFRGLFTSGSFYSILYLEVQKTQHVAAGPDSMTKLLCAIVSVISPFTFLGEKHHMPASIFIISTDYHMLSLFLLIIAFQRSEHFLKPFQQDYNILFFFFRYNLAIFIPTNVRELRC